MAIINRDLGSSQQRETYQVRVGATVTGATYLLMQVSSPSQIVAAGVAVSGLSGAPNHSLWLGRFIVGTGYTSMAVGASLAPSAYGTSSGGTFAVLSQGASFSLQAGSSATYPLQTGDVLMLSTAGANTATADTVLTLVVQNLQDVLQKFGV